MNRLNLYFQKSHFYKSINKNKNELPQFLLENSYNFLIKNISKMKGFIKTTILGLVMLFISLSTTAQTHEQEERAYKESNKLSAALKLDDDITNEIYEVYLTTFVTSKDIITDAIDGTITEEKKEKEIKYLWKTHIAHIEALIGSDLVEDYKAYRKRNSEIKTNSDLVMKGL